MKTIRLFSFVMVFVFLAGMGFAGNAQESAQGRAERPQEATQKPSSPTGQDSPGLAEAGIESGTKIEAELESALDARTAKPGDVVMARVTKDVKQEGRKVVKKGDRLMGRVTDVKAGSDSSAKGDAGSQMAVTFDRLVQGETTSQLNAVVTSVLSVPAEDRRSQNRMRESEPLMMPTPAPVARPASSGGGGGLLGGVGSTVGSTAGATGAALGGVTGGVSSTVDSATSASGSVLGGTEGSLDATSQSALGGAAQAALATPRKAIQLDSQSQARAENESAASSVLSTRQGDLRMDSGTKLEFRTEAEAQAKK